MAKEKRYRVCIVQRDAATRRWLTLWEDEAHTKIGARIKMSRTYKIIDNKYNIASQLWDRKKTGIFDEHRLVPTKWVI